MIYATGTVTLTPGSNAIVGDDTLFTKEATLGALFFVPTLPWVFQVGEIIDDRNLLLAKPVPGSGGRAVSKLVYVFPDHFTPVLGMPMPTPHQLSVQTQAINRAWSILDREMPSS